METIQPLKRTRRSGHDCGSHQRDAAVGRDGTTGAGHNNGARHPRGESQAQGDGLSEHADC